MRSYLHIITFIILHFTADCGAQHHVVYKSTGEKAHLTLKEHTNVTAVKWRKDHHLIATVEKQTPAMKYPGKYHIHVSDKSLFIHNLTINDSGHYQAQTGLWEKEIITYKLIVQEPVSEPVIVTNLDDQANSSSVCHFLVKCSADDESVTYECNHLHCTRTNFTSTRVNITINYTNPYILECTASNRVSTKHAKKVMNSTCYEKQSALIQTINYNLVLIIIISCTVVLGAVIICAIKLFYNSKKKKQNEGTYHEEKGVNTVYSVVHKQPRPETPEVNSDAQNAATTVYDVPSNCTRAPQHESGDSTEKDDTHTVYWKLGQTQNL